MPKLIVLFFGAESPASTLAEAAADGATGVRFTEVDLRAGNAHEPTTGRRHKVLESPDRLRDYDGVVLAAPAAGEPPSDLTALLDRLEASEPRDVFADTVFAVVGGENTVLLGRVSRLGGIIVSEPMGVDDPEARARATGKRVAKVIEWVRHAQSHEHSHSHEHGHHHH
ncbi:MAG: NAD(P)H-dependent oxidoreductase [bacterium]